MSWSLEVFSPRAEQVTVGQLAAKLSHITMSVVHDVSGHDDEPPHKSSGDATGEGDSVTTSEKAEAAVSDVWSEFTLSEIGDRSLVLVRVQAVPFGIERDADPQLLFTLEAEIAVSDAEDGAVDEPYTNRLNQLLRSAKWHYILSVERNDDVRQEQLVVQATYALSQIAGGVIHDLQSGAWMDAELFESILDAYAPSGLI